MSFSSEAKNELCHVPLNRFHGEYVSLCVFFVIVPIRSW